ncbi:MAG: saccharopine dehydrogenase C-terminal domain-containing protein [candidate division WOR-3 bacterium]
MKVLVLGCGMQGRVASGDLAQSGHKVTVLDANPSNLKKVRGLRNLRCMRFDVTDRDRLIALIRSFDVVLGALPAALGFYAMQVATEAGVDIVDMSYQAEDPFRLDQRAKRHRVRVVPDAGFCPGLSNILIGEAASEMGKIDRIRILVGGIPQNPIPPFNYRITWSPADLIAEYTRPARIVKNFKIIIMPALSGVQEFNLSRVGRLECFYTDGLRTLLKTFKNVRYMEEKTIRYPGHAQLIKTMFDWGFLTTPTFKSDDKKIDQDEYTVSFLKSIFGSVDEKDLSILTIEIRGRKEKRKYTCVDYYDEKRRITSMARLTAYTGSIITQCIKSYPGFGVIPPEYLGQNRKIVSFIHSELRKRKVHIKKSFIKS